MATTRVSLANDVELVVRGLEAMLARHGDFEFAQILIGSTHVEPTEVLLIDTFGGSQDLLGRMRSAIQDPSIGAVVLYSFTITEPLVEWARAVGLSGVISKATHGESLASLLAEAASGEFVRDLGSFSDDVDESAPLVKDLSFREAEVLALMAAGRTNAEIAQTLYLSVETVKTYVSRVFTKIDVRNRTEAALWAARVGLGHLDDQRVLETADQVSALH
jgi:DNA-binding NarL/FixJ family response regulator